ncbi:hypothetical protein BO78DRAFT_429859 [Aspergillus sclerotiicarbonarius CBS 121057]|uniref:C2H2 finger domain protein n=1 Tax=Aspergillus sclerotiicarbonarius (strain CBS 121057 / IBT 28362) TaxID=1448318 RepID=A0A319E8J1_ASPSB|nr:hypothetical protein BO78DRAFT_429859 [Aspergillus sclerotiicarbonarius CBS 121057]
MDFPPSRRPLLSSGPFVCTRPDCGKSFLRKEHLNRHLAVHTNSRPHKCFICGRTFARTDILNRHVLQHNVPPDSSKRTPLACQTCRRRKTKCDSKHPCSTCADTGDACVREPSSMQASMPTTRSRRKNLFGEEDGPMEAMEEDDPGEEEIGMMTSTGDTFPMQQDWVSPMNGGDRNSISSTSTRPTSLSAEQDLLLDPCISMMPEISIPASNTDGTSSLESGDQFATSQPSGIQIKESASLATRRSLSEASASGRMAAPLSSSGWPQLHEAIASQVQFVTTQIKSADFDHFHQIWPMLHVPTFTPEKHTPLLTSALANLAMWMQDANRHHLVPYAINQELTQALMPKITDELLTEKSAADVSLQTLQALVITLIYAILGDAPMATLNWAAQWTDITISTFRRIGALNNQWLPENQQLSAEERWVACEEMKRLVYIVMRIDAYLCIILNRPPTLRYQEMGQPLPMSEALWRAETRVA